jgi:hypothetical protein
MFLIPSAWESRVRGRQYLYHRGESQSHCEQLRTWFGSSTCTNIMQIP